MKPSHMYRAQPDEIHWYYEDLIADLTPPKSHRDKVFLRYYRRLARKLASAPANQTEHA